ncbi:MAG: amino acid ABC transporter permease [Bacilli bacterium]|nr:amino acid ABC transporter permease [Bacilli bacterium]
MFYRIGVLLKDFWVTFLNGMLSTLVLALVGTFVGLLIGIVVALGRNLEVKETDSKAKRVLKRFVLGLTSVYVNLFRGTPMMVQAMIIFFGSDIIGIHWLDINPFWIFNGYFFCGLVVITINTGAYMSEIVRSGLNGVDKGQEEASRALGMSYFKTMTKVIMPQAIRNALPTILNEYIVNVKDSSVLNVIGLTELYASVSVATSKNYFKVEGYIIIAIIYLVLTLLATLVAKIIQAKLENRKINLNPFKSNKPIVEVN